MNTTEKLLIASTFVMGIFAGAYFYFTGFASTYGDIDFTLSSTFTVTASATDDTSPLRSYQLQSDGSYRGFVRASSSDETVGVNGEVTDPVQRSLRRALRSIDVAEQDDAMLQPLCDASKASYWYRFAIDESIVALDCMDEAAVTELRRALRDVETVIHESGINN